jgi:SAM-dependent methyltransferase
MAVIVRCLIPYYISMRFDLFTDLVIPNALEGNPDVIKGALGPVMTGGVPEALGNSLTSNLPVQERFRKMHGKDSNHPKGSNERADKMYYAYMFFKEAGFLEANNPFSSKFKLRKLIAEIASARKKEGVRDTFDPFGTMERVLMEALPREEDSSELIAKYAQQLQSAGIVYARSTNNPHLFKLMIESTADVEKCFDLVLSDNQIQQEYRRQAIWDLPARSTLPYKLIGRVLKDLKLPEDTAFKMPLILELGVGNGENLNELAENFPAQYVGIDVSEAATAEIDREALNESIVIAVANGARLSFADDSMSCVLACGVIGHLQPALAKKVLAEAARVTVDGGYIVVAPQLTDKLVESGLKNKAGTRTVRAFQVLKDENGHVEIDEVKVRVYSES